MRKLFLLALFLSAPAMLAACATGPTETAQNLTDIVQAERGNLPAADTGCKVPADLIGQSYTVIETAKLKNPIRLIFPGTQVSGETVRNRLNVKVDKKGVITAITCG